MTILSDDSTRNVGEESVGIVARGKIAQNLCRPRLNSHTLIAKKEVNTKITTPPLS